MTKAIQNAVLEVLAEIGEDPRREGLVDTPSRVAKSYREFFSGYNVSEEMVADILKTFEDGACDEIVLLKNIDFVTFCEHHILPVLGIAHIAYLPDGKVVGLSKLARVLEVYSKRLQLQERLTQQVTKALDDHLMPKGSACIIEANHQCISCRGVAKKNAVMVTSSLTGAFRSETSARLELMSLVKG